LRIFLAQIASILALILAWVYIFDTVLREREALERPAEGIVGAVPRDPEDPPPAAPGPGAGRAGAAGQARPGMRPSHTSKRTTLTSALRYDGES
jgi:hypothetical protein